MDMAVVLLTSNQGKNERMTAPMNPHSAVFKAMADGLLDSVDTNMLIKLEDMLADYMEAKGLVPDDDPYCHPACDRVTELLRQKVQRVYHDLGI